MKQMALLPTLSLVLNKQTKQNILGEFVYLRNATFIIDKLTDFLSFFKLFGSSQNISPWEIRIVYAIVCLA